VEDVMWIRKSGSSFGFEGYEGGFDMMYIVAVCSTGVASIGIACWGCWIDESVEGVGRGIVVGNLSGI
jgi:hypothetical protein